VSAQFSKVSSVVILHRKFTGELTFQKFGLSHWQMLRGQWQRIKILLNHPNTSKGLIRPTRLKKKLDSFFSHMYVCVYVMYRKDRYIFLQKSACQTHEKQHESAKHELKPATHESAKHTNQLVFCWIVCCKTHWFQQHTRKNTRINDDGACVADLCVLLIRVLLISATHTKNTRINDDEAYTKRKFKKIYVSRT